MKELSIEEKAKSYDERLAKARKEYSIHEANNAIGIMDALERVFPELKQSEDERIRKEILDYIIKGSESLYDVQQYGKEKFEKWIAWVEKQGEQKLNVNDNAKEMFIKALERVEEQNAKGYKLTDCDKKSWWEDFKAYTTSKQILANSAKTCKDEQKPAEEYNITGIGSKNAQGKLGEMIKEVLGQKPAWSEEDEAMQKTTILYLENTKDSCAAACVPYIVKCINWLKSLRPQNTWKPSDEQIEALEHFVRSIGESGYASPYDNNTKLLYSLLSDLKKLREE